MGSTEHYAQAVSALIRFLKQKGCINEKSSLPSTDVLGKTPIKSLGQRGIIDEERVYSILSTEFSIPYRKAVSNEEIKFGTLLVQSALKEICTLHLMFPLSGDERTLTIALSNPFNLDGIKGIEFAFGKKVIPVIAPEGEIHRALSQEYRQNVSSASEVVLPQSEEETFEAEPPLHQARDIEAGLEPHAPPVVQLVDRILADGIRDGASDIHVEPTESGLSVRFRIDGAMRDVLTIPRNVQMHVISRFKLIAGMDLAEKRRPQDGRAHIKAHGERIDVRVSSVPAAFGEKMVLRILMADPRRLSLDVLSLPTNIRSALDRTLSTKAGLLLVTGPTGSGKTTTLYSCLNALRTGTTNIVTIEDPIEFKISGINQIQINDQIDVTFASVLRSVLRQDPDVILVGEIRDGETAKISLQAAQTGHLVLSTLHTNDAPSTIARLLDIGVDAPSLVASLRGILAQRLVRKVCEACRGAVSKEKLAGYRSDIRLSPYPIDLSLLTEGHGCNECQQSGYRGRVGIYSYLEMTPELGEKISHHASLGEIRTFLERQEFRDLGSAGISLVSEGITTLDEVIPYLPTPDTRRPLVPLEKKESPSTFQPANSSEKRSILVVDDNPDIRMVIGALLKRHRYEVTLAESGEEALSILAKGDPDLILLDLKMPRMSGLELLSRLRKGDARPSIPVIVLTASDSEEDEVSLLNEGASDFISKASSPEKILARIHAVIGR